MDEYPALDRPELQRREEIVMSPDEKTGPVVLLEEESLTVRLRRWLQILDR